MLPCNEHPPSGDLAVICFPAAKALQRPKQFGAALGFAEINLVRKGINEREALEAQKLKKFSKRQGQSNIEQEYITAMSEEVYKNLLEMNQTIRRREIMTKIND